jgi:hypothetical protein
MAEWLKAAVLKTVVPTGTVGSNPTPSARKKNLCKAWHKNPRRDGRDGLRRSPAKRVWGESSIEGSNPSLSAI